MFTPTVSDSTIRRCYDDWRCALVCTVQIRFSVSMRPLNNASLWRCVPWTMCPLEDASLRRLDDASLTYVSWPWTAYRRWIKSQELLASLGLDHRKPIHWPHLVCPTSGLYSSDLAYPTITSDPPPPLKDWTYRDASSTGRIIRASSERRIVQRTYDTRKNIYGDASSRYQAQ
jgi:hypothetical protein